MNNQIVEILTGISEIQSDLAGKGNHEIIERLSALKSTALKLMEQGTNEFDILKGYRQDTIDQAYRLHEILENVSSMPDSELFRVSFAAEALAAKIRKYYELRSHVAVGEIAKKADIIETKENEARQEAARQAENLKQHRRLQEVQ